MSCSRSRLDLNSHVLILFYGYIFLKDQLFYLKVNILNSENSKPEDIELELTLSVTTHINCIVACCLINVVHSRHVPLSGHDAIALFE